MLCVESIVQCQRKREVTRTQVNVIKQLFCDTKSDCVSLGRYEKCKKYCMALHDVTRFAHIFSYFAIIYSVAREFDLLSLGTAKQNNNISMQTRAKFTCIANDLG